jgi:hypothetical protein
MRPARTETLAVQSARNGLENSRSAISPDEAPRTKVAPECATQLAVDILACHVRHFVSLIAGRLDARASIEVSHAR